MAKVNVEVTHAVVSGKGHGEHLELEYSRAKQLEEIGYVRILSAAKTKDTATKQKAEVKTAKPVTKDTKKAKPKNKK